jgi:hypothetical protein
MAPPLEHEAFEGLRARRDRKARRGRVAAASLSLILAVGAIAGALFAFGPRGSAGHTAAGAAVDLSVGPEQYAFDRSVSFSYGPEGDGANWPLYVERDVSRSWYRADDSGRHVFGGRLSYFTDADREADKGLHDTPVPYDHVYGPDEYPVDSGDLSQLSTDPTQLRDQLLHRSGTGGASPMPDLSPGPGQDAFTPVLWATAQTLLGSPNASPDLRAALFEVAESLRGVDVTPSTTDPVGRPATLLSIVNSAGIQDEWWFDPSSEQLLAQRYTIRTDSMVYPRGSVAWLMIVEASGVTDATGDDSPLVKTFVPAPVTDPPAMPDPRH